MQVIDTTKPYFEKSQNEMKTYRDALKNRQEKKAWQRIFRVIRNLLQLFWYMCR